MELTFSANCPISTKAKSGNALGKEANEIGINCEPKFPSANRDVSNDLAGEWDNDGVGRANTTG